MKDKLNIIYLCSGRSFFLSNINRKIESVAECWRKKGHDILHICGGDIISTSCCRKPNGYGSLSHYRKWYRQIKFLSPIVRSVAEKQDIQHDLAMVRHLEQLCKNKKTDIIWERSCRLHYAGLIIARRLGIPYILEWKDHLVDYRLSFYHNRAINLEAYKNREANFIVVESGVLKKQLEQEGINKEKIIIAHNAVHTNEFKIDHQKRKQVRKELGIDDSMVLVGYLGSYAFYHDTSRLVLSANILGKLKKMNKVKFLMIGEGKEYDDTRKLAERYNLLGTNIIMKPGVPKQQVPEILSALDIAVLPGSTDIICPIKVQEYMSMGLPTIVPDYECNREVITNETDGILFAPHDAKSLAEMIINLTENPKKRDLIGTKAKKTIENRFTWEATWGKALEVIIKNICKLNSI